MIQKFDLWCLDQTAKGLVFLNEWLNLSRTDVVRGLVIGLVTVDALICVPNRDWTSMLITMVFCGILSLPNLIEAHESWLSWYGVMLRTSQWVLVVFEAIRREGLYFLANSLCLLLLYVLNAPKPPSDPGRRRQKFLEKFKFREFDPIKL